MEMQIIGIPLTFLVLFAVTLWFIILGKGRWWLKAAVIPVVLYFSLVVWFSLAQISGWASDSETPETFAINWIMVKEPSKRDPRDQGAIFMWASEVDENHEPVEGAISPWLAAFTPRRSAAEPRAYRLPYSRDLHEKAVEVQKMISKGKTAVGKRGKIEANSDGDGKGSGGTKGSVASGGKTGGGKSAGSLSRSDDLTFYELPAPKLPEKITDPDGEN